VYERASLILGLSPNTTRELGERFPQIRAKLRTVLYPIDIETMRPGLGPSEHPYIFLSARIQDPRKNINSLVRAFAQVHKALPQVRLIIAGDAPTTETMALVTELGLNEATEFAGFVAKAELLRLYQEASVFALPSQQEGLCISMLEAMACAVPVVSTRCGGPEGIVEDGQNGYLVANGDEAALAERLINVLQQPDLRARMAHRSREIAVEEFSQQRVLAQLNDAFHTTFGGIW
jgi:glycosyltransferase involved in cell wall biosynthesis